VPEGLARDAHGASIYESEHENVFEADGNEGYYFDHETNLANSRRKLAFVERHSRAAPGCSTPERTSATSSGGLRPLPGDGLRPGQRRRLSASWRRQLGGLRVRLRRDGAPWDGVSCWDVVEHLDDPQAAS
jgi:hypothetical protein